MKSRQALKLILLGAILHHPITSKAFPKTDADFAVLPPYCAARYGRSGKSAEQYWRSKFGTNWIHLHHYCSGLHTLHLANMARTKKESDKLLSGFVNGIDYMLEHGDSTFILLPELHTLKGEALIRLERYGEAVIEFYNSIKINPKYTKSYRGLSQVFEKQGKHEKAIDIIQEGLKHSPNSKSLKRKLEKLND